MLEDGKKQLSNCINVPSLIKATFAEVWCIPRYKMDNIKLLHSKCIDAVHTGIKSAKKHI